MQYRGNPSQLLAAKVRQISGNKKIENMLAIPQNFLCSWTEIQIDVLAYM